MIELVLAGIVAGFLAGISPCILPVLPIVLVAGASTPAGDETPASAETPARVPPAGLARSLAVVGGLILSFSIIVLAGSELLSLLHLPQDALRDAGIALLILVGLGYLIPGYTTALQGSPRSRRSSSRLPAPRTPRCPPATRPPTRW